MGVGVCGELVFGCALVVDLRRDVAHHQVREVRMRVTLRQGGESITQVFDGTANIYTLIEGNPNQEVAVGEYHVYFNEDDLYVLHDITKVNEYRLATKLKISKVAALGSVVAWQGRVSAAAGKNVGAYASSVEKLFKGERGAVDQMLISYPQPIYTSLFFEVKNTAGGDAVGKMVRSVKVGTPEVVEQWILSPNAFADGWTSTFLVLVESNPVLMDVDGIWRYVKESLNFVAR